MDHESAYTPAALSPAHSLPASAPVSLPLPSSSAWKTSSIREEQLSSDAVDEEYELEAEQREAFVEEHANPASLPSDRTAETTHGLPLVVEATAPGPYSTPTEPALPPAASLPFAVTGAFPVHNQRRSSSSSSSSSDRVDPPEHNSPALSAPPTPAKQPSADTALPAFTVHQPPFVIDAPPTALSTSVDSPCLHSSDDTTTADDRLAYDSQCAKQHQSANHERGPDPLSLSAIAPAAQEESAVHDHSDDAAAMSVIDADFAEVTSSTGISAESVTTVQEQAATVVIEDEAEEEEEVRADATLKSMYSTPSLLAAAASPPLLELSAQAALPAAALNASEHLDHVVHRPAAHAQPTATARVHTSAMQPRSSLATRPAMHQPPPPAAHSSQHQSARQQQPARQTPAMRHRPTRPQPARAAPHRGVSSVSSPPSAYHSQYAFQASLTRRPQPQWIHPLMPALVERTVVVPPVVVQPPLAPIAPSAPYVASKQALLQTLARHEHQQAARRLQALQQQQQQQAATRAGATTAEWHRDALGSQETSDWRARSHVAERLARMLKLWHNHNDSSQHNSSKRQDEQKEEVEWEWQAQQEEQRRLEERTWQRNKQRRPATPADALRAAVPPEDVDEDGASEMGSEESADLAPPSMVQLMENLRASARQEIAVQEAARQGLR